MRVLAVAQNTFREAVRDRVLYVLLFLAAAAVFGSKAIGWVSIGQDIKIVKDISLAAVSVFGVLIAIFVGANLVYKEIDKRTIYTILSRPLWRWEFVLGKYLGLMGLLALVTVVMAGAAAVYVVFLGGAVDRVFFLAVLLIYAELMLVTALAVMLSAAASPILGALVVFSVYVIGHTTGILADLPEHLENSPAKPLLEAAYYVVPNLSNFNIRAEAANGVAVSGSFVLWAMVYGLAYTVMLLALAAVAFEDKDV
jgi:Cu-processing system permease protein